MMITVLHTRKNIAIYKIKYNLGCCFVKIIQVSEKIKVVLYYKESTKEMKKNAQKIHSLFIIIKTKTVKTHKKRF